MAFLLDMANRISIRYLAVILGLSSIAGSTQQGTEVRAEFGGTYDRLGPEQQKLVDDWFERYNQRTHKNLQPETGYNAVPVSVRTTFEAITNALLSTSLTNKSGDRLGTSLDVVQSVETVRGRAPGAEGDLQFRIYVALRPGAVQTLESCREFSRKGDNSVYHNGYPVNFRQQGGTPSIQVSVSRDGKRADIDVDYRRSGFPAALFNGHLTAENSDVRAGNNFNGHLKRWNGLANWWRNLFGLSVERESGFVPEPEPELAIQPRLTAAAPLEDAVHDYLSTWLVERKLNLAVAYVSKRDYPCVESSPGGAKGAEKVVPKELWHDMEETNFLLGKVTRLSDAVARVDLEDTALLPIGHKYRAEFTLVKVPDDVAAEFNCAESGPASQPRKKYGTYYGSAFRIKAPNEPRAGSVLLLWRKEQGFWKIISQQVDAGLAEEDSAPSNAQGSSGPQTAIVATNASPTMIRTVHRFLDVLFIKKDADAALHFFAPISYACLNGAASPERQPDSHPTDAGAVMREYLGQIASRSPSAHKLEQIIERFDPDNPTLVSIHHDDAHASMLVSVPEDEASDFMCLPHGSATSKGPANSSHGPYFGTFFKIIEPGEEPAGLGFLWAKESADWKIVAFQMDEP